MILQKTIKQSDDDFFVDWWLSQQPELTEEETKKEIERLEKAADYVLKHNIKPNLDSIY